MWPAPRSLRAAHLAPFAWGDLHQGRQLIDKPGGDCVQFGVSIEESRTPSQRRVRKHHEYALCLVNYFTVGDDRLKFFTDRVLNVGVEGFGDVDVEPAGADDLVVLVEDGIADDNDFAGFAARRGDAVSAAKGCG